MKSFIFAFAFILSAFGALSQDITGLWTNFKNNKPQAVVQIYKSNDCYFGKITKMINPPNQDLLCDKCKGNLKGKPLVGLIIISNLTQKGKVYSNGTILDPNDGKVYNCNIQLDPKNSDILIVKGSLGPFSKSNIWKRGIITD
jgi:Uncharacterized protein conserved in bacteria